MRKVLCVHPLKGFNQTRLSDGQAWKVMRLMAIFLLAACMQVCAKGYTQNVSLQERNAKLEDVFQVLKKQTGLPVLYTRSMLKDTRRVTVNLKNVPLQDALNEILKDQGLDYSLVNNTIVIKVKETTSSQETNPNDASTTLSTIDVSGKVTDTDGKPLEGATVSVKGTKVATKTDAGGVFILKGIDDDANLEISFSEYETVIIKVSKRTSISVALKQEIGKLEEVVINKGYYTEKQRNTVGNVTTITAKDIEKQPVQNPLLALQGRVPGLEVTQLTGLNGGGVKIQIQGNNSIGSLGTSPITRTDPLIVVDGVPFPSQLIGKEWEQMFGLQGGSPLNFINPNDIESIDVLKDADATSLYGSRAANGAILITTKKGKTGKSKVSFNLQQGWGNVTRRMDMMNSQQYVMMRKEALRNTNRIASSNPLATGLFSYAPDLTIWDTTRYTDWQEVLIGGTAKYTNLNANVSGGNQAVQYLVGGTYNRQSTVYPGDFDDKRGSVHFNINTGSAEQRLKLGLSGSYMFNQNGLPGFPDLASLAILLEPVAPALYKADGTLNWAPNAAGTSTWNNPVATLQHSDYINTTKNLTSNLNIGYHIMKGLDFGASIGYTSLHANIFIPVRIENNAPEKRPAAQRSATYVYRNMSSWIIEPQLNYEAQLDKGRFQALIGTTIQKNDEDFLSLFSLGFASDQLMKTLLAAPTVIVSSSFSNTTRYNALFGRFNYTWDNKYIFNFTARRDGSNKFGDNNKFSNFWSTGAAWIFTDEPWIQKHLAFLNFGKLRMSYGITGNDQIQNFAYLSTYTINNPQIFYQGGIGLDNNGVPNPYLQWEETRKWQSGIDLSFFRERIIIGFTYARNRSSNQLVSYSLPIVTGASSMVINWPALVQNTSLEFVLNTVNISNKNFSWTTNANLTIPRNKLVKFPGIENTIYKNINNGAGIVVGQPLGVKLVARYAGINPANGVFSTYDNNGNPITTIGLQNIFVNLNSKYYAGLTNSFKYKGFQLDFLIQFVRKKGPRDMYWDNGFVQPGYFVASASNQPVTVINRWQKAGDNALVPRYNAFPGASLITNTDAYYSYDASFARLKNVSLSWQLPSKWVQKMKMQTARVYAHAQNLATITNYTGMDPESGARGMPPLRMITTGVNVEF